MRVKSKIAIVCQDSEKRGIRCRYPSSAGIAPSNLVFGQSPNCRDLTSVDLRRHGGDQAGAGR